MATELIRAGGLGGGIGSVLYTDKSMAPTPGPVEHFVYNAVGHTTALTNGGGSLTQTSLYEAFGDRVATSGSSTNNRLANTKERDASIGLDNHGFRYYDPESGRYITRDPIGYGDGMNPYQSVRNNPINRVDPLGLANARQHYRVGDAVMRAIDGDDGVKWQVGHRVDRVSTWGTRSGNRSRVDGSTIIWSGGLYDSADLSPETFQRSRSVAENHIQGWRDQEFWDSVVGSLETVRDLVPMAKAADLAQQGKWKEAGKAFVVDAAMIATGAVAGKTLQMAKAMRVAQRGAQSMDEVAVLLRQNERLLAGAAAGGQAGGVTANKLAGDAASDAVARQTAGVREGSFVTVGGARKVDVLELGEQINANEVKTGRTALTADVRRELARDWWLRRQGQVDQVNWIFKPSPLTGQVGPTAPLQAKLDKLGFGTKFE